MKKLLILIVAISVYLHFYPNAEVTKFYSEKKEWLSDFFSEYTDTKARMKSSIIYDNLESEFNSFSEKEIAHLKEITDSRHNVKDFNKNFCQPSQRHEVFHKSNQTKVCNAISVYISSY
tara:strand:+ start:375 stop:731 length:357 start_codon:yes stop_codon:yes gene_type:complete